MLCKLDGHRPFNFSLDIFSQIPYSMGPLVRKCKQVFHYTAVFHILVEYTLEIFPLELRARQPL